MLRSVLLTALLSVLISCRQETHPPVGRLGDVVKTFEKLPKEQRVEGRYLQEVEMTADPITGLIPKNRLAEPRKQLKARLNDLSQYKTAIAGINWQERGPSNVGGRTRAIMFDPNDNTNSKVWAGSVGGGLWYTDDITAANVIWNKVDDFWSSLAISALAFDPTDPQILYAGTGEAYGNADAISGDGIWKSTDSGLTWNQLNSTTSFSNITSIKVLGDGTLVVGTRSRVRRSTDGGMTWVTPSQTDVASLSLAANGDLYIGGFYGDISRSTDDGANWSQLRDSTGSRVHIACAPSDMNTVYAVCYKSNSTDSDSDIHWFQKSSDGGSNWSDIGSIPISTCNGNDSHFTRGQGWYDLSMIVHPTDADKLVVGGVDIHTSDDSGDTWKFASNWYNCSPASYVHADIHTFVTRPGYDNSLLVGCDGGVFFTDDVYPTDVNGTTQYASFDTKISGYNVTQFYHGDIHPTAGLDYCLAGAQDNGTQRMNTPGIDPGDRVTGGDGAYTHIDQDEPNIQISAYTYNNYFISKSGFTGGYQSVSIGNRLGQFINPTDYDWKMNVLYGSAGSDEYSYVKNIGGLSLQSGTTPVTSLNGRADHVYVSPNVTNRIYLGNGPRLIKIDDAQTANPQQELILIPGINNGAYMSSIYVEPGNDDNILVTYSNYNAASVMQTLDGGATWTAIDGNLPNIPVRSVLLNPNNSDQIIIATELGVWSSDNIDGANTGWDPTNANLANVRTDHLAYRASDNEMIAVTHGRGVFSTSNFDCGGEDCHDASCRIGNVTIGNLNCDAIANEFTVDLQITLYNTPNSGTLQVNGSDYPFAYDTDENILDIQLSGPADGLGRGLSIRFSDTDCEVFRPAAFIAPTDGCDIGLTCEVPIDLNSSGTYTIPSIASGNGCNNCDNASNAFWYKYSAPCDGIMTISSCGYLIDTRVHLYEGNSCNSLVQIASTDDDCSQGPGLTNYASEIVDFQIQEGKTYYIEWDDRWSQLGFDWDFTVTNSDIIYVDDEAVGNESGCSWENALTDLQEGITLLESTNDFSEIWVRSGIYKPGTSRLHSFVINPGVAIYGGFNGTETDKNQRSIIDNPTILSGDIGLQNSISDNCYIVVTINEGELGSMQSILDGFIVEKGNANHPQWPRSGAGINSFGNALIANCTIRDCLSEDSGSAICHKGFGSNLQLEDVIIVGNDAINTQETVSIGDNSNLTVKGVVIIE